MYGARLPINLNAVRHEFGDVVCTLASAGRRCNTYTGRVDGITISVATSQLCNQLTLNTCTKTHHIELAHDADAQYRACFFAADQ